MVYERIDESSQFDGKTRNQHEMRYRIAAGFLEPLDVVVDACCGTGYGRHFIANDDVEYIGIDKNPPEEKEFVIADFDVEEIILTEIFGAETKYNAPKMIDVFVGLEGIEHLTDHGVKRFVSLAHSARKWIIVSTPIVPNSNPYHVQHFSEQNMLDLFIDDQWEHYDTLHQGDGKYGIFVFKRKQT